MKQFVVFSLDDRKYGIEILYIRELNQVAVVTPVERAPDFVCGLINLRGQVVTVIDAGLRLGCPARRCDGTKYTIILKTNAELSSIRAHENRADLVSSDEIAGLLVDSFSDVIEIADDQIEALPANIREEEREFVSGVVQHETELFSVLNVSKILTLENERMTKVGDSTALVYV